MAELHSKLLAETTLRDFAELWPERFHNVTNGVTPRRFMRLANPGLAELITEGIGGEAWLTELELLAGLEPLAEDPAFRAGLEARAGRYSRTVMDQQRCADLYVAVAREVAGLGSPAGLSRAGA